ncbi:MAG: BON domain-containing protein [Alphaproteobacteria bacterium]|nr:BON domain-containing protein [Alphaproteobacteria bacterium]
MKFSRRLITAPLVALALSSSLSGCIGVSLVTQERSLSSAVDDFNAQTQLNARLLGESPSLFANTNLTVIEGRVHMSGTVPTNEDRLTATRLAWATPHVKEIVNDLEVTDATNIADAARDRWISAQVRGRILTDRTIHDVNYTIDTQNKVVYILGIAQNQTELDRVVAHAHAVPEARRVVNYALLKSDPRRFAQPRSREEFEGADAPPPPDLR